MQSALAIMRHVGAAASDIQVFKLEARPRTEPNPSDRIPYFGHNWLTIPSFRGFLEAVGSIFQGASFQDHSKADFGGGWWWGLQDHHKNQ